MAASKQGSAAKIPYFESLDSASKVRYLAKLKVIGNLDPYTMSADRFSADPTYLPSVNYANIYTYLVNTPSPYTKDELECYKGLDAYNQFVSGWVRDVKATVVENSHLVIGRRVMEISQVSPGLFLGGLDSALNLAVLSSRNITLVVNASGLEDLVYPQLDGLQVLHVLVQDRPHIPLRLYFDPVGERIHQNQTGRTLVHCNAGRSRSPTLIMAYLMRFEGLSLRRAHEVVLDQRPFIRPNAGFWRQLMDYERTLFSRTTMRMVRTSSGVLPEALQDSEDLNPEPDYCVNI